MENNTTSARRHKATAAELRRAADCLDKAADVLASLAAASGDAAALPKPDPAFAAEVSRYFNCDDLVRHLLAGEWVPSTPAEIAAALRILAQDSEANWAESDGTGQRLHALEERFTTGPEWVPAAGNVAEKGLLESYRFEDGSFDFGPVNAPTGFPLADLGFGHLRPQTWPQLLSCLRHLAAELDVLITRHDEDTSDAERRIADLEARLAAIELAQSLAHA